MAFYQHSLISTRLTVENATGSADKPRPYSDPFTGIFAVSVNDCGCQGLVGLVALYAWKAYTAPTYVEGSAVKIFTRVNGLMIRVAMNFSLICLLPKTVSGCSLLHVRVSPLAAAMPSYPITSSLD